MRFWKVFGDAPKELLKRRKQCHLSFFIETSWIRIQNSGIWRIWYDLCMRAQMGFGRYDRRWEPRTDRPQVGSHTNHEPAPRSPPHFCAPPKRQLCELLASGVRDVLLALPQAGIDLTSAFIRPMNFWSEHCIFGTNNAFWKWKMHFRDKHVWQ